MVGHAVSYRLQRLQQKRERDEGIACDWYRKPIRDYKRDPSWFWMDVMFYGYMVSVIVFLAYLLYELTFGSMSLFKVAS